MRPRRIVTTRICFGAVYKFSYLFTLLKGNLGDPDLVSSQCLVLKDLGSENSFLDPRSLLVFCTANYC